MQAKHAVVLTIDEMGEGEGKQDTPIPRETYWTALFHRRDLMCTYK